MTEGKYCLCCGRAEAGAPAPAPYARQRYHHVAPDGERCVYSDADHALAAIRRALSLSLLFAVTWDRNNTSTHARCPSAAARPSAVSPYAASAPSQEAAA